MTEIRLLKFTVIKLLEITVIGFIVTKSLKVKLLKITVM